ncbi:hypothetical protein ACLOJK_011540 [Asimina triloba]
MSSSYPQDKTGRDDGHMRRGNAARAPFERPDDASLVRGRGTTPTPIISLLRISISLRRVLESSVVVGSPSTLELRETPWDHRPKYMCLNNVGVKVEALLCSARVGEGQLGCPQWEERLPKPFFALTPSLVYFEGDFPLLVRGLGTSYYTDGVDVFFARSEEEAGKVTPVTMSEALAEPDHARMMGPTLVGPLEGIFVTVEGSHSVGPISTDLLSSSKGPSRPLFLEGALQVIDLEEEGGPAPSSIFMGEPKLETTEGDVFLPRRRSFFLSARWLGRKQCNFGWSWRHHKLRWLIFRRRLKKAMLGLWPSQSTFAVTFIGANAYRRQEEYECSHYFQSGYVRALSDVVIIYPSIDLSPLYQTP